MTPPAERARCQTFCVIDEYTCRHFSLSNPEGPSGPDLPLLLRRLADAIQSAGISSEALLDVSLGSDQINEYGTCWRATVDWAPDAPTTSYAGDHPFPSLA